jgi:phage terminase small subunit
MFADNYLISMNATDAYLKSGYVVKNNQTACSNGHRLLRKADIQSYIAQKMAEKDNERVMSQDELLERYTAIARGELTEEQLLVYNNRHERVRKEPSFKDQISAMKELAKRYPAFSEKKEVIGDFSLSVDYGEADDDTSEDES